MKALKYGKLALLRNPKAIFKSKRSIRFQFDMFHGNGNLDKAINLSQNPLKLLMLILKMYLLGLKDVKKFLVIILKDMVK